MTKAPHEVVEDLAEDLAAVVGNLRWWIHDPDTTPSERRQRAVYAAWAVDRLAESLTGQPANQPTMARVLGISRSAARRAIVCVIDLDGARPPLPASRDTRELVLACDGD